MVTEKSKVYITVLLFVKEGAEHNFQRYEENVLPILEKYNGELLYRIRPGAESFINNPKEKPYEIHLVSFETIQDFESYKLDEERLSFNYLFQSPIERAIIIEGFRL